MLAIVFEMLFIPESVVLSRPCTPPSAELAVVSAETSERTFCATA